MSLKKQGRKIKEEEHQEAKTSSWVEAITKTKKKVEEAEKWIKVAKGKEPTTVPNLATINMTSEEEQRRKVRALHGRVIELKDRDDVEGELNQLLRSKVTCTKAWRVGKKREENVETSKERALILHVPSMEAKDFLKRRPTVKKIGLFLGDDLIL